MGICRTHFVDDIKRMINARPCKKGHLLSEWSGVGFNFDFGREFSERNY